MKFWRKYFWFLALLHWAGFSFGQSGPPSSDQRRARMQSLFLYNFASKYMEWPKEMKKQTFVIGILGDSPILTELRTVTTAKKVFDQPIEVRGFNNEKDVKACNILFIPFDQSGFLDEISEKLKQTGTLIIAEKEGALNHGAGINFVSIDGKLKFETNLGMFKCQGITVAPDLLKLSINTIESECSPGVIKEMSKWEYIDNEIRNKFGQEQTMTLSKYKSSLISYLAKEIKWPNENVLSPEIKIGVLCSGESDVYNDLMKLSKNSSLGNLSINPIKYPDIFEVYSVQILYVSPEFNMIKSLNDIITKTADFNTLIVTDEFIGNEKMVNFKMIKDKLKLEIFKENIEKNGMKISKKFQDEKNFFDDNFFEIPQKATDKDWEKLYSEMEAQLIKEKQTINLQKEELARTKDTVNIQGVLLSKKEKEIETQISTLRQLQDEIKSREILIEIKKEELNKKQKQISQQDKILNKQVEDINKQKFIISSAVVMFVIVFGFVFFVVRSNLQRKKAYRIITAQKEQAEKARQIIEEKKEELEQSYSILTQQQEELQKTFTELKNTQSQLVQSEKMASLGQLTAGVAHEINNPINFVSAGIDSVRQNYTDIKNLLDKYFALPVEGASAEQLKNIENFKKEIDFDSVMEEMEHLLKSIKNGAMRTTEIVKSLRNFSRLDEYALKKANIQEGIDSTLTILTNKFKNRIEIVKEYGMIPEINCFPGQLNQAFMNILNNAIDAVPVNGTIHIKTAVVNNLVEIRIKDTGKGMTEEVKRRIFEPFFTTKNVGDGTGLGLSITFGIIEKHKGSIQVESEPGKGTEFIIQIPMNLG